MIAITAIQTSFFHFIANRSKGSREPLLGSDVRAAGSSSSVGTLISLWVKSGLSYATHCLFRDLRAAAFPAVELERFR
jgi:hypothetical protein